MGSVQFEEEDQMSRYSSSVMRRPNQSIPGVPFPALATDDIKKRQKRMLIFAGTCFLLSIFFLILLSQSGKDSIGYDLPGELLTHLPTEARNRIENQ